MPAGMARLQVSFKVDADGLLSVEAEEKTTGKHQHVEVKPSYGLTDEEVERMLIDAYEHGEEDVAKRALREQQVEARRILTALEQAMVTDAALLEDDEEKARIEAAIAQLREALEGDDHNRIRTLVEELDHTSKAFAGRRMDRSIQAALGGRDVRGLEDQTKDARGIEPHLGREAGED